MGHFPLLELPKDLISLLLNNYFHPVTALRCLRVCKRLNDLGDRKKIIFNALKFRLEEEFNEQANKLILCPLCHVKLDYRYTLKNHLRKHKEGEEVKYSKYSFQKSLCEICGVTKSNMTNHHCVLNHRARCHSSRTTKEYYPWSESLCIQNHWYDVDPNFKKHVCYAVCKACKEIFKCWNTESFRNNGLCGSDIHLLNCPKREQIIEIYRLKGDKSMVEWARCFEQWGDAPSENEILFEKEWEEWKRTNIEILENAKNIRGNKFSQKPY